MATDLVMSDADIPTDEDMPPMTEMPSNSSGDYDPQYPGSTREAPYGYFDDGRPRKRRPRGSGPATVRGASGRMPASESKARQASAVLATGNTMLGLGLLTFGMTLTAESITEANKDFEELAYQALLADPALCNQILAGGAMSGKAMLIMAYAQLGLSVFPAARQELKTKRLERVTDESDIPA